MSMATVEELQAHLETYLAEVSRGHEVLISRGTQPIARLAPVEESTWRSLSAEGLAGAYGEGEPDYSAVLLKEANPEYRP
jgi:prevent-host-death family protein